MKFDRLSPILPVANYNTSDFFNFENVKIKLFVSLKTYQQMWCVDLFNSVYVQ